MKIKKIMTTISIGLAIVCLAIIGIIITNSQQPPQYARGGGATNTSTRYIDDKPKPKYYTYAPNTIKVQQGSDTINFQYTPSVTASSNAQTTDVMDNSYTKYVSAASAGQTIAYEYIFGATSEAQSKAVNLGSIGSQEGVTISYWWQSTPLQDGEGISNSPAKFTCQEIASNSDIYLYVIISSESANLPADFTTNIQWQYGKAQKVNIYNNINSDTKTFTIISGQTISSDILPDRTDLNVGEDYEIKYYSDKNRTNLINADSSFYVKGDIYVKIFKPIPASCFTYSNGGYTLADDSGLSGLIVVPNTFDDGTNGEHPVTAISNYVFQNNTNITSVDMSECTHLTTLGAKVFDGCENLVSVIMPEGITSIGIATFNLCFDLISINIPDSVISMGLWAFYYCSSLTSITIPSSVTSIGGRAFEGCTALAEVYNLSSVTFTAGANNEYGATNTKVIHTDASTPSRLTTIDDVIYYKESDSSYIALTLADKTKTRVTLDSRTTSINQYAFYDCSSLTSIDLSNCTNLTSIGDYAFSECSSLTSITIPSSVTSIGNYAFQACSKLTSITFSDTSTWYRTSSSDYTNGIKTSVTNPTQNATNFTSTSGYYDNYWYKV